RRRLQARSLLLDATGRQDRVQGRSALPPDRRGATPMALNAYLTLETERLGKILGSCPQEGHKDEILVCGFSHEIEIPRDLHTGQPTGKRQHKPLVLTKEIDQASPLLAQACVDGDRVKAAKLKFYRIVAGMEEHYFTIEIKGGLIVTLKE